METIPKWTLDPVPGTAEYEVPLPEGLVREPRALLAAHARVLAALSGEREVTVGYVAAKGERPRPCRLTVGTGSWHDLLEHTREAEADLAARRAEDEPAAFETVLDPHGGRGPEDAVLHVAFDDHTLRLRYRTDVLDADAAARIAGYHLTALTHLSADADAEPGRQSLLSDDELRLQLDGLAGPHRELPDRRVHELFEERVLAHPDAVAAVQGDRQWTYQELNSRANQLGRALLTRGLRPRGRRRRGHGTRPGLDGRRPRRPQGGRRVSAHRAALPGRTHRGHPGARRLRTRPDGRRQHHHPGRGRHRTPASCTSTPPTRRTTPTATSASPSPPDQLAYIYFTSGSTGEPKGAMCEHAGFLNHVHAKLDDLGVGEGQVVAQTAPQCFDISLWQLVSALLVGGRTLLVEQEVILDVPRFVDTITGGRVNVLQVVPSYLEAVLAELEQRPRELPDLRCVSVTGEAVKKELVAALVRGRARHPAGQRLRADRDLGRHQSRGHGPGAGPGPGPARPAGRQRAGVRRRRGPIPRTPRRARRDRLLRGLRRPRVRQRPRADPGGVHHRPVPPG